MPIGTTRGASCSPCASGAAGTHSASTDQHPDQQSYLKPDQQSYLESDQQSDIESHEQSYLESDQHAHQHSDARRGHGVRRWFPHL